MTAAPEQRFELAPWQRIVRTAGLIVSGAGLAATVSMVFSTLFPRTPPFPTPLDAYASSLWASERYDVLVRPLIMGLLFVILLDLFFTPQAYAGKDWGKLSIRWAGLFGIAMLPIMFFYQDIAGDVSADPFVSVLLIAFAFGLCLLLALLWPAVGPRFRRPRGMFDLMEALLIVVAALAYPAALVQAAVVGSSYYLLLGGMFYFMLISGAMRGEPRKRADLDNAGAEERGSNA